MSVHPEFLCAEALRLLMDKKNNHRLWAYILAAALIAAITAFSIKWPDKTRLMGDEYTGHIYNYDTYKLLSAALVDGVVPRVSFNPSDRYSDEFTFTYDEVTGSYLIYETILDQDMYLCITSDRELTLTSSPDDYGCRWDVVKVGNTMYYMIVNSDTQNAIALANSLDAVLVPFDMDDTAAYVRFQ